MAGNDVLRDVLRLMTGTVGGRLITLAAMPVVTRLYSPEDFAMLALYLAVVSMIGAISCLRFDVAIPVAHDDNDAAHLLVLALTIALGIAGISLTAVLFASDDIAVLLGQPELATWLWLVPIGILLSGSYAALQFWTTRARRFGSIAKTRISQAAVGTGTMIAMGSVGIAPLGLLLGNLLNSSSGSFRLGIEMIRRDHTTVRQVTWPGLRATLRSYRRFPLFSTPEALTNLAGVHVSIMIIATFAGPEVGFLLLAQQVVATPMTLIGSSVSQVYVSRAPQALREGCLASFTHSILRRLLQIGAAPIIIIGILSPALFPMIFGGEWTRSGEIVAWLVPWMALQFLASPISMVMHVVGRQFSMLALTAFGSTIRIGAVLLAIQYTPYHVIEVFAVTGAVFYGVCLILFCRAAGLWSSLSDVGIAVAGIVSAILFYGLLASVV